MAKKKPTDSDKRIDDLEDLGVRLECIRDRLKSGDEIDLSYVTRGKTLVEQATNLRPGPRTPEEAVKNMTLLESTIKEAKNSAYEVGLAGDIDFCGEALEVIALTEFALADTDMPCMEWRWDEKHVAQCKQGLASAFRLAGDGLARVSVKAQVVRPLRWLAANQNRAGQNGRLPDEFISILAMVARRERRRGLKGMDVIAKLKTNRLLKGRAEEITPTKLKNALRLRPE